MKQFTLKKSLLWRIGAPLAVLSILAGVILPVLSASAAGQVTSRSIKLSDSAPSGNATIPTGVGSGTSVAYNVTFTPATTHTIGGIVVDICSNTPLIGDTTCNYPTGFTWGSATPTLTAGFTGMGTGWTTTGTQAGASAGKFQVLELTNTTPQSLSTSTAVNFEITGVTNPDISNNADNGNGFSFYARILTFDTSGNMTTQYTTTSTTRAATFANNIDNGGVAMSTATPISITARVMETLQLCTSKGTDATGTSTAPALNCGSLTAPAVIIGHGVNNILDSSAVDTASVYSQLSTNAQSGAAIRMHASTSCGGLSKDGGGTCPIAPVGATLAAITAGNALFGVNVQTSALTGSTGTITPAAKYNSSTNYAMDATTAGANVTATYGDILASSSAAVNSVNMLYTFAASASNTTPAGIYTTQESLIATGTF